jgi:type VI secretion system protein ImpL
VLGLSLVILAAGSIWFMAPHFTFGGQAILATPEKRIYVIASLLLLWLLKFLLIDLATPHPFQYKDPLTRNKLQALHNRFRGAVTFLKKTSISKQGKSVRLNELPWYLLVGPMDAGKTSLLANAEIHYILQRQFATPDKQNLPSSENVDWWVTREACIIDVPGKYLSKLATKDSSQKNALHSIIWHYFLRLLKKQCGSDRLRGIIIALPLAEFMKVGDTKKYHALLRQLLQRIHEVQKVFPQPLSCQLILTKCDLVTGFNEFFSEATDDEIQQAWGVTLSSPKENQKIHDILAQRFDALIKRLNQQLLWRLHQERNPMARPYIKDFPLQIERLKEFTVDFVKKLTESHLSLELKSVYLTSALQPKSTVATEVVNEAINHQQRGVQLFQQPGGLSRPHFVKQLLTQSIHYGSSIQLAKERKKSWNKRVAIAASAAAVLATTALLGQDFQQGAQHAYLVQNRIADYQRAIEHIHNADEHLTATLELMNSLKQAADAQHFRFDFAHITSFYSQRSEQKVQALYEQALQNLLIPELKLFLTEYLKNPVNKNNDLVYAALKSYLMLGDSVHFEPSFIVSTMQTILPKSLSKTEADNLLQHIQIALQHNWSPITIDQQLVQKTRHFFSVMPDLQLSYIILKNTNNNSADNTINLGLDRGDNAVFTSRTLSEHIPTMFTAQTFAMILASETVTAGQEAIQGNWIIGNTFGVNKNLGMAPELIDQLRQAYLNRYIDTWEKIISNIQLTRGKSLAEVDELVVNLISNDSPLLQLLNTVHDNTYFEPITSASPKLQALGSLVDKSNASQQKLYQLFTALQNLHQALQQILSSPNRNKAAFDALSSRILNQNSPDAFMQLRIVGERSPEPIKNWLDKISDDVWRLLIQDAGHYIDTSWQQQVGKVYQADIAGRYPFGNNGEVDPKKFIAFFGNPGLIISFYQHYLLPFVDTSHSDWRWRSVDNQRLAFSEETLRQIQQAMNIHKAFFPNGDNKLLVQFSLQPQLIGKNIKSIQLSFDDKRMTDEKIGVIPHMIAWSGVSNNKISSVLMTLTNHKNIQHEYHGQWGWHKLITQAFESHISSKQSIINLSQDDQPAKYMVVTEGKINPFFALNLKHFHLPNQISEKSA